MQNYDWIESCEPEEQGIPSHAINWFFDQAEREELDIHSIQIVRNGKMVVDAVALPFTHDSFHRIFSAAKGLVATAVLFAVQDGFYSLDEKVIPRIPRNWLPENLDPMWEELTLYHLLTMNTGHDQDTLFQMWGKSECWVRTFFEVRPAHHPGTFFCYDMGAQYVMNEMIRLASGKDTGQYLHEKLFSKLGIEYQVNYTEPEKHFFSSTIQLKPDALTKLSLFYLQNGKWKGEQILDSTLAECLGKRHSPSRHYDYVRSGQFDNLGGYGLHMWRNPLGGYRFAGGQGQFGIVIPEEQLVISVLAGEHRSGRIFDLILEALYSEMYRGCVPVIPEESRERKRRLSTWNLAPGMISDRSSMAEKIDGVVYRMDKNETGTDQISFRFLEDQAEICIIQNGKEHVYPCGLNGHWAESRQGYLMMESDPDHIEDLDRNFHCDTHTILLSGGWAATDIFTFSLRSASLLCEYRFYCQFTDAEIVVTRPWNDYLKRTERRSMHFTDPKKKMYGKRTE